MNNLIRKSIKVGMYSPYLDIMGGGEKYFLNIAEALSKKYPIDILNGQNLSKEADKIFNIKFDGINIRNNFLSETTNKLSLKLLKGYGIFIYMTDGSLFFPVSNKNFLIIQSPVHTPKKNMLNMLKLMKWKIICYSQFMKSFIEKSLGKQALILSPCINTQEYKSDFTKKENIILSIGRFFPFPHNKKHEILINIFKKNYQTLFKKWRMIIAGNLNEKGGISIFDNLKKLSQGYPIEIRSNLPFDELINLYNKSKIYWHATGYGEDLDKSPEKAEHFGITTLEAMAAGVVPIVFAAGGQKDIIDENKDGFFWKSEKELVTKTLVIINSSKKLQIHSQQAVQKAEDYSCHKFYEDVFKIIQA